MADNSISSGQGNKWWNSTHNKAEPITNFVDCNIPSLSNTPPTHPHQPHQPPHPYQPHHPPHPHQPPQPPHPHFPWSQGEGCSSENYTSDSQGIQPFLHTPNVQYAPPQVPNIRFPPSKSPDLRHMPSSTPNVRYAPPNVSRERCAPPPFPNVRYMPPSASDISYGPDLVSNVQYASHQVTNISNDSTPTRLGQTKQQATTYMPQRTDSAQERLSVWLTKHNLSEHGNCQILKQIKGAGTNSCSLLDIKLMLHKLNVLRLKLKEIIPLKQTTVTDSSLDEKKSRIQGETKGLLAILDADSTKEFVKAKMIRAQKRKARRQRHKQRLCEEAQAKSIQIGESHKKIDKWLEAIQEQKRTELMKKAADQSMSGVRQKIADALRQKELIASLVKLRSIREQAHSSTVGTSSGHSEAKNRFTKKTSELTKLLDKRLDLYKMEENALKVMLKSEHEETLAKEARIDAVRKQRKLIKLEKQNGLWLFGPQEVSQELKPFYEYYTQSDRDFDSFINIRLQWDSHIVSEDIPGGSRIPRGWVIPQEPSSSLWAKYLKQETAADSKQEAVNA